MAHNNDAVAQPPRSLRVRHEEALGELERYKILVDSVQDYAIFLLDADGHIMTWNKGAEKFKGYKPSEIIGRHFSTFYQQEDIDARKPERELELAQRLGRVEDEDWRVRKDGTRFWANVVITPLYAPSGTLIGYAKVTRDLSERKAQEDALRTVNFQLKKHQKELERLNRSKDEFISVASHQLRTPATAIKQLLGMLREGIYGNVPEDIQPVIERAYLSNERLINIVNNLLKVAQIDAGKIILRKQPVEVGPMLHDIAEEAIETARSRGQHLKLNLKRNETPTVLADSENLRMAISNLVDNASKYTPENGTITLGVTQKASHVIISVTDTGVGIAPADQAKLFGKFVRVPNELSQKVGGSGLGLYWVQKVIELHGGTVEVESALGKGTAFRIKLPETEASDA